MTQNQDTWLKDHEIKGKKGVLLLLYIQPGASKTGTKGVFATHPPRLKVSVHAPPVEGAANQEVISWLCESLGVPKSKIILLSGEHSRHKNVWIEGLSSALVLDSLE